MKSEKLSENEKQWRNNNNAKNETSNETEQQ